jgi:signal transduction histidine kinase
VSATGWGSVLGSRLSVRWRVTTGASLVLALALVVVALAAAGLLRRALTTDEDALLVERVDEVESLIEVGSLTSVLDPPGPESPQVQVVDSSGAVVATTPGLADVNPLDVVDSPPKGRQTVVTVDGATIGLGSGAHFRVVARTVASPTGPLTIYAVKTNSAAHRAERYLRNAVWFALPVFVLLTAWFISRVVRRALAPVEAMRVEVDRIEANERSARVAAGGSRDEVGRLAVTLNRMLDRLEEAASRQELFAASASHELRSPLSAIRTEVEVALAYPDRAEWQAIGQDLLIEVTRLEELSRDLRTLTRSRSAVSTAARRFDLAELVASEVARRRPLRPIDLGAERIVSMVVADRDGVVRVVRNLLDNAERHAASEIRVEVTADADGVTLVVANDGEPIPIGMHERIFDSFTRLDEARTLDAGGSGLGLAIARLVMQTNGGTLVAAEVARGAEFRAWFPALPSAN